MKCNTQDDLSVSHTCIPAYKHIYTYHIHTYRCEKLFSEVNELREVVYTEKKAANASVEALREDYTRESSHVLIHASNQKDRHAQASHGIDRQTDTSHGIDRQTDTSHGIDRQTDTSHGIDRQTDTSHGIGRQILLAGFRKAGFGIFSLSM